MQLRLALEALLGVCAELRRLNQLDCDVAIEPRVVRAIDDSHAAATELGHDFVAFGESLADQMRLLKGMRRALYRAAQPSAQRRAGGGVTRLRIDPLRTLMAGSGTDGGLVRTTAPDFANCLLMRGLSRPRSHRPSRAYCPPPLRGTTRRFAGVLGWTGAACVTVTVRPPTEIVPVLDAAVVLGATWYAMEALPVPEALDNVIQATDFVAVHVQY